MFALADFLSVSASLLRTRCLFHIPTRLPDFLLIHMTWCHLSALCAYTVWKARVGGSASTCNRHTKVAETLTERGEKIQGDLKLMQPKSTPTSLYSLNTQSMKD